MVKDLLLGLDPDGNYFTLHRGFQGDGWLAGVVPAGQSDAESIHQCPQNQLLDVHPGG